MASSHDAAVAKTQRIPKIDLEDYFQHFKKPDTLADLKDEVEATGITTFADACRAILRCNGYAFSTALAMLLCPLEFYGRGLYEKATGQNPISEIAQLGGADPHLSSRESRIPYMRLLGMFESQSTLVPFKLSMEQFLECLAVNAADEHEMRAGIRSDIRVVRSIFGSNEIKLTEPFVLVLFRLLMVWLRADTESGKTKFSEEEIQEKKCEYEYVAAKLLLLPFSKMDVGRQACYIEEMQYEPEQI